MFNRKAISAFGTCIGVTSKQRANYASSFGYWALSFVLILKAKEIFSVRSKMKIVSVPEKNKVFSVEDKVKKLSR